MATLIANEPRAYATDPVSRNDLPMIASDIIYEGAAVGDDGSGLARPLVAADPFLGFASRKADNSAGVASAEDVKVYDHGTVQLSVTGVSSADDVNETVYATDDNTFTLTASGASSIGKVLKWVSGTTCLVYFEAVYKRSI